MSCWMMELRELAGLSCVVEFLGSKLRQDTVVLAEAFVIFVYLTN
jgi:hypothetical protein